MGCWTGPLRGVTLPHTQLNRPFGYKSYCKAIPTESLMMVRKVLLKRMQNWVRQLAEKLWQPSVEEESCRNTPQNKPPSPAVSWFSFTKAHSHQLSVPRASPTDWGFKSPPSPAALRAEMHKIPLQRAGATGRGSARSPQPHLSCSLCHKSCPSQPWPGGCSGPRIHQRPLPSLQKKKKEGFSVTALQRSKLVPCTAGQVIKLCY